MSKKSSSTSIRPKLEVLIILVFFLSFIVWAASKCNATKIQEQIAEITTIDEENPERVENPDGSQSVAGDPYGGTPLDPAEEPVNTTTNNPTPTPSAAPTNTATFSATNPSQNLSTLFVTIDGLNMRTAPHLDSAILYKLPLFEEVYFLNEVTDSTQKISLGAEIADEPWVKIKHKKGRVGWVYGAGVNYYRKARLPQ